MKRHYRCIHLITHGTFVKIDFWRRRVLIKPRSNCHINLVMFGIIEAAWSCCINISLTYETYRNENTLIEMTIIVFKWVDNVSDLQIRTDYRFETFHKCREFLRLSIICI